MRNIDEWYKAVLESPAGTLLVDPAGVILARQDKEHGPSIHLDGHWFAYDIFKGAWRVEVPPDPKASFNRVVLQDPAVVRKEVVPPKSKDLVIEVFTTCSDALNKLEAAAKRRCLAALMAIFSE